MIPEDFSSTAKKLINSILAIEDNLWEPSPKITKAGNIARKLQKLIEADEANEAALKAFECKHNKKSMAHPWCIRCGAALK
jgi:hypothetical protein